MADPKAANCDGLPSANVFESKLHKYGRTKEDLKSNYEVEDGRGNVFRLFKHEGLVFPPFGDLAVSQVKDTVMRDDDVFIAGFPKTGTHWLNELVAMIRRGRGTPQGVDKEEAFLEFVNPSVVTSLPSPRTLNSHLPFDKLPKQLKSKKTKIILPMRNVKDTMVSFYNHKRKIGSYTGDIGGYMPLFLKGQLDYGSFFDTCADWERVIRENPDHPIIVMSFEDMKEDLPREVRRLAKFLDVDLDEETLEAIARAGQFDSMAKHDKMPSFIIRKGQVGDWKNWFTVAQNEMIDAVIEEKMPKLSIYTPRYTLP